LGNNSNTTSPVFQVRFSSTYEPGGGNCGTALSLIITTKPSPAHDGRRNAKVKARGFFIVSFSVAALPSGKVVSIVTVVLVDCQFAIDGTYKLTQKRSPDS